MTKGSSGSIRAQWTRLIDDEPEAREWLYDTTSRDLLRRLRRRYGAHPGVDVEELLHDTYVFVFSDPQRACARFALDLDQATQTDVLHWLFDLACGLAANKRRSWRRAAPFIAADEDTDHRDPTDIESQVLGKDALEQLGHCLRESDETTYLYFVLRFLDGHSPAEIESMTSWNRSDVYRLRDRLRDNLDRCIRKLGLK